VLTGYSDQLGYRPGDVATFMVAAEDGPIDVKVQLVRVRRGYAGQSAPRVVDETVGDVVRTIEAAPQRTSCGSCVVAADESAGALGAVTLIAWIWPTTPTGHGRQGILVHRGVEGAEDFGLFVEDSGELSLRVRDGEHTEAVRICQPLRERAWHVVYASLDTDSGAAIVGQRCLDFWSRPGQRVEASATFSRRAAVASEGCWLMGAADVGERERLWPSGCFNGRIEAPAIWPVAVANFAEVDLEEGVLDDAVDPIAAWDFGRDFDGEHVHDRGPRGMHGVAINMPTRAVEGRRWDASTDDFTRAPDQYAAIHFHADDVADCRWQPSFSWTLPSDLRSGVYAARLMAGSEVDHIPFVVRPPASGTDRRVVVVLPTFTYLAYANAQSIGPEVSYRPLGWEVEEEPLDRALGLHPEYGLSLYDTHCDGSEVVYSTALRPVLTMRPGYCYRTFGSARHLGADLFLLEWLDREAVQYDVITDADLHARGAEALRQYDVVLTGSHPEYCSGQMLDGLRDHVEEGGHVMYLGGNGFWVVTAPAGPGGHGIEIRRCQEGGAADTSWVAAGDHCLSATGELGGKWATRGHSPNALFGIGCGAVGVDHGRPYTRTPLSYEPEHRFVFEGVQSATFGDFGLSLGGAAGDELDRVDPRRGTPPQTRVLATATGFSDYYRVLPQDQEGILPETGGTTNHGVRADMVHVPHPSGGGVFSVGSITWISALPINDYDNDVARITRNVLARFRSQAKA
jgi:N,N-dimethylformamidase